MKAGLDGPDVSAGFLNTLVVPTLASPSSSSPAKARTSLRPYRAWSRNDLLDRVWSTEYEGYQRNIDPHINRLRKKLEADPKNPHYVLTVRGVGYKLNESP